MQQESIATTATQIGMILTRHWDEGDTNASNTAPILVTQGDGDLNASGTTGRRAGTPMSSDRTFLTVSGGTINASGTLESENNDSDDIDDFNGNDSNLTVYNSEDTETSIGDYIDTNIIIRTTVTYLNDTPTSGTYGGTTKLLTLDNPFNNDGRAAPATTSSIKLISVRLTSDNPTEELGSKNIILNAFSCNIGTFTLNERSF